MDVNVLARWESKIRKGNLWIRIKSSNKKYFIFSIERQKTVRHEELADNYIVIMSYCFNDKKVMCFYHGYTNSLKTPGLVYFNPTREELREVLQFLP